jgi:hypothetical protein
MPLAEVTLDMVLQDEGERRMDEVCKHRNRRNNDHVYCTLYVRQMTQCGRLCAIDRYEAFFKTVDALHLGAVDPRHPVAHRVRTDVDLTWLRSYFMSTPVSCVKLFAAHSVLESAPLEWPPPRDLPLGAEFTLGHRVPVKPWYFSAKQQKYAGGQGLMAEWTPRLLSQLWAALRHGRLKGTYGPKVTGGVFRILQRQKIEGSHVLVVGSEQPWVEAICLFLGARSVTTLEYGRIRSTVKHLHTLTPDEYLQQFREGTLRQFDLAVAFHSIEHSGLGRYGDGINPWGDLVTVARLSCVLKTTGRLVIGVPSVIIGSKATDLVYYNAHRVYGRLRWPMLLTNFWPLSFECLGSNSCVAVCDNISRRTSANVTSTVSPAV